MRSGVELDGGPFYLYVKNFGNLCHSTTTHVFIDVLVLIAGF